MKIICVMGNETKRIVNDLKETYTSIEIEYSYNLLKEMCNDLKTTPVKVDKILITENSFDDSPMKTLISLQDLIDGRFFVVKEVLFLMYSEKNIAYVKSLFGEYTNPAFNIQQNDTYNFQDITYLLGGKDALEQNTPTAEYSTLVRRKIGAKQTINFIANEENESKGVMVFDDLDAISEMYSKLEAQENLIKIHNVQISTEAIIPKVNEIPEGTEVPIQQITPPDMNKKKEPKVIVVTGERGSGKTSMTYALGKSYSQNNKVLLIDLCSHNMGLSGMVESLKEDVVVMFLHELLKTEDSLKTKALLSKFYLTESRLSALLLSTEVKAILSSFNSSADEDEILASIMEIILAKVRTEYDIVLIDLPIAKYGQYSFIFNTCDYLILTFHRSISSAVSLGTYLLEKRLYTEWYKMIFIPTDVYRDIEGLQLSKPNELKDYLGILMKHEVLVTSAICLTGFNIGSELSLTIDNVISALPSKTSVSNYYAYLNQDNEDIEESTENINGFVNPFVPKPEDNDSTTQYYDNIESEVKSINLDKQLDLESENDITDDGIISEIEDDSENNSYAEDVSQLYANDTGDWMSPINSKVTEDDILLPEII